jgi:F-type H+-transporting ATPase subunit delta
VQAQSPGKSIDLKTEVKEDLIGGFVLEMGDRLVDASIAYDLKEISKQFLNNDFIYKIR